MTPIRVVVNPMDVISAGADGKLRGHYAKSSVYEGMAVALAEPTSDRQEGVVSGLCFLPIQNVLNRFGASLPVFSSASARSVDATSGVVVTERAGPKLPVFPVPVRGERV
ncbi:hypothetical protein [Actinokineospora globicatena]|nr:hypothetical protein [Actinokineospora globicatena]